MRVLVAGQAKSGTTALYSALKQSLPPSYLGLFEPSHLETDNPDVIAKIIIGESMPVYLPDFEGFDRKILIVRDPRDNLVSRLLYLPFDLPWYGDDEKIAAYGELLSQKQHQPDSVSVLQLLELLSILSSEDLIGATIQHHQYCEMFVAQHPDYFVVRYEDFIANQVADLEKFLGFRLSFDGEVGPDYAHIARKKGMGDWRNWLTNADSEFFRPIYQDFLLKHNYEPEWVITQPPHIEYRSSVDYFRRLIQRRAATEARTALLGSVLAERDRDRAYLNNEIVQLQSQIKSMSDSKFWKLRNYYVAWLKKFSVNKSAPTEKVS